MAEDILKYQAGREAAIRGRKLRVLDLFSGIGGFSLGLEAAGMETVAFCEFDETRPKNRIFPGNLHRPDILARVFIQTA